MQEIQAVFVTQVEKLNAPPEMFFNALNLTNAHLLFQVSSTDPSDPSDLSDQSDRACPLLPTP